MMGFGLELKHKNTTKISKHLRITINAPCYVTNTLYHDLNVPYVRAEIKKLCQRYAGRLEEHPNTPVIDLMNES